MLNAAVSPYFLFGMAIYLKIMKAESRTEFGGCL